MPTLKSIRGNLDFLHHDHERRRKIALSHAKAAIVAHCGQMHQGVPGPDHPEYKQLAAFVDKRILTEKDPPSLSDLYSGHDNGTVRVWRLVRVRTPDEARRQLRIRREHMKEYHRQPGQDSRTSRSFMTPDTLVVVYGERDFLAAAACCFTEEEGRLVGPLIEQFFTSFTSLGLRRPRSEGGGRFNIVRMKNQEIYPDVIDEFLGLPKGDRRLTTEEMLLQSTGVPKGIFQGQKR